MHILGQCVIDVSMFQRIFYSERASLREFLSVICSPELINERVGLSVYVACHILALCPACVNPVIYGYLNENFRKVYKNISVSVQSFRHGRSENCPDSTTIISCVFL